MNRVADPNRRSKHYRQGPQRAPMTERQLLLSEPAYLASWHTTKPFPWQTKAHARVIDKLARASRKASRP